MNKMCYQNLYVTINYISDLVANFNNYDDKISKQLHHATYYLKKIEHTTVILWN